MAFRTEQKNIKNSRKEYKKKMKAMDEIESELESESSSEEITVSNLQQGYVMIQPNNKFLLLLTFLRKNPSKKIIVFFSSHKEVEFYTHLLNKFEIVVKSTYMGQKQQKITEEFFEFTQIKSGILLCTELVQKDLVFPDVDWIIQYDAPQDKKEYAKRVSAARGANGKGKSLLILLNSEIGFVKYLTASNVDIKEMEFPESRLLKIQDQCEKHVNKKDHFLLTTAYESYRSYMNGYINHTNKDVFDINNLDLTKVCKSFGLVHPPMVNLSVSEPSMKKRKMK